MMYVKQLQIHSCDATWSSNDKLMYKETTKEEFEKFTKAFPCCETEISEQFKFSVVYIKDEHCCKLQFGKTTTKQQMQERIDFWKSVGDYTESLEEFSKRKKAFNDEEERIRCENRKNEGYIFYTSPDWKYKREEAQGGFSDELWSYEPVVKYTETHSFGYFGHSVRKPELDKYFEKCIKVICQRAKVDLDWKKIAYNYLSSSSARHFSDSLEHLDFSEQKRRVFGNLKSIWNQAYIFSFDEHEGTLESTQKLTEKYKDNLF